MSHRSEPATPEELDDDALDAVQGAGSEYFMTAAKTAAKGAKTVANGAARAAEKASKAAGKVADVVVKSASGGSVPDVPGDRDGDGKPEEGE